MPPSASKAPNATGSAEVRYSATKHSLAVETDQSRRGQPRHRHPFLLAQPQQPQQQQRQSSFSLGCIFDNPVAFEDSSLCRRKIDYTTSTMSSGARIDVLECQIKSVDVWKSMRRAPAQEKLVSGRLLKQPQEEGQRSRIREQQHPQNGGRKTNREQLNRCVEQVEEMSYDPAKPMLVQTCRRKLCLEDDPLTAPMVTATTQTSGLSTPLLDECEVFSELSGEAVAYILPEASKSRRDRDHFTESVFCTPVRDVLQSQACSPVSDDGTSSLRSLNALDNSMEADCDGIELEDIGTDASRRESFRSWKGCVAAREGPYFVYPGWSMWSREHSYRSLAQDSPVSKNSCAPSIRNFPGVKTLSASLRQHLAAAAAGQRHISSGSVNRSSSTKTVLSSKSSTTSDISLRNSTNVASRSVKRTVVEEGRVPLLKSQRTVRRHFSPRKRWEPVTYFRKGLKALASKGFAHDGLSFPTVFPLPGCGLPRFDQSHLVRPKRLISKRPKDPLEKVCQHQQSKTLETTSSSTGYLQCILRHGITSYSFWMDELDEVLVARLDEGDRRDKRISFYTCKGKERSGWRHWQRIRKRVVNVIGTMSVSCCIYTEVDLKGQVMHFMDSEFSLFDERPLATDPVEKRHPAKSRVASYLKALIGSPWQNSDSCDAGMKPRKELAAMVIRVPLEVKKAASVRHRSDKLSTPCNIAVTKSDSVHVILPTGDHGHPAYGLEGPRPLLQRWRSGGLCDCGSWDLGCGMITLSRENHKDIATSNSMNLVVEGTKRKQATLSLSPCRDDGLYRLSFQKPLVGLQAFASAVAILHSKIHTGEMRYGSETKLPVTLIARRNTSLRSSCPPNPPLDRL